MKHLPVKSWTDPSVIEKNNKRKDNENIVVYLKDSSYGLFQSANIDLITREITKGFKPKWYVVIHFNDGGHSKRELRRRLDPDEVKKDLKAVKQSIYSELYGKKWKKRKCARSIWGIEYGTSYTKPHINLLIEDIPCSKIKFEWFLNQTLPVHKVKCLWKQSAHVEDVYHGKGNIDYITKECDMTNSTIVYELCDFIK